MEDWIEALSLILKIFTAYTAVISIFFLLPRRKIPRAEARTRFAVLLAARNEEAVIGRTVQQLLDQHYPRELFDVYVIPNTTAPMIRRVLPGGLVRRFCLVLGRCGTRATLYTAHLRL